MSFADQHPNKHWEITQYDPAALTKHGIADLASQQPCRGITQPLITGIATVMSILTVIWTGSLLILLLLLATDTQRHPNKAIRHGIFGWIYEHGLVYVLGGLAVIGFCIFILTILESKRSVVRNHAIGAAQQLMRWANQPLYRITSEPLQTAIVMEVTNTVSGQVVEEVIVEEEDIEDAALTQQLLLQTYADRKRMEVLDEYLRGPLADEDIGEAIEIKDTNKQLSKQREAYYQQLTDEPTVVARTPELV